MAHWAGIISSERRLALASTHGFRKPAEPGPGALRLGGRLGRPDRGRERRDAHPALAPVGAPQGAGRFVVGGLRGGLHRVVAEAPGFGSVEQGPVQIPGAAPVLRMETDGNTITGVVTAGGSPAGGARVVIGGENLAPTRVTTTRA